ncbi:hypothetical protein ASE01_05890 [Nocardioides sp. Root190]|uniref:hypothetical protein n=1 Tax=Nocardioides sp. Root190 TaxID=1736488 RepID=UPI0006F23EF5|nr:hypothetical protein [Nocardioides sp. Root190]KRB77731.1 hypothetical protein ASE01_05890 [Nocardioides sp. Root190]
MIAAHPFGDPQTVEVATDPTGPALVHLTWKVGAADDLTLLGIHLGVLPEDRVMLDGAISYDAGDAALVAGSTALADYALDHLQVEVTGDQCRGTVAEVGDLVAEGAELVFTCPAPVASAAIEVTTLTDLHPAYRTLATGPGGQHAVYSADDPAHDWALPVTGPPGSAASAAPSTSGSAATGDSLGAGESAALQIGGVLAAVLLLVVAGVFLARRRRRTTPPPPTTTTEGERRARTTDPAQAP